MTRIALFLMWLLHWLPLPILALFGRGFGHILYVLGHERRHVALTNLRLCFPDKTDAERQHLARLHFAAFGRSFLERGLLWWAPAARLKRLVKVEGIENIYSPGVHRPGRPIILLVPHFVGLDMGWTRLSLELDMVSIYANQKNLLFNAALLKGRQRFGRSLLLARQQGTRPALKAMQTGKPFYYLPDMDYGARDTVFTPFFGVPAATITGLSRLARMADAAVLPVITQMTAKGYTVRIGKAWEHFPGANIEDDTRRMNAYIETEVSECPAQYFWLHKRFKTRPPGEKSLY